MTNEENIVYEAIFNNSIFFLKRSISELLLHDDIQDSSLKNEPGLISTLFIQMSIELALKSFLIKNSGLKSILEREYKNSEELLKAFNNGELKTKSFWKLSNKLRENKPNLFTEEENDHILQFQHYRNSLVHLNLFLFESDLYDLKFELIYVIVHIIFPLLKDNDYIDNAPGAFYKKYLSDTDYLKLIDYPPYVEKMKEIAESDGGNVYMCLNCNNKTFSTNTSRCYNCDYEIYGAGYTNCISCKAKNSIIYDIENIEINDNAINGLCLNCEDKINVFKCPECESVYSFHNIDELTACKPNNCFCS